MVFSEGLSGERKAEQREGRQNEGGNFMAIPPVPPGDIYDEEAATLERRRLKIEELEIKITEIENDLDHPEQNRLEELRNELRSITQLNQ